jgi:excisionase family DNA binding protein
MTDKNDLLTIEDFAAVLRVKPSCIRRWILERRITSVKVGRLVRIPSGEVARIIRSGLRPFQEPRHLESQRVEVHTNG